jgi:alkylhydroperoxidase/carboxymuconolactone decarboxylase family protein YurZ
VQRLDKIDQNYLNLWLTLIYEGLYRRGVLDDKTRVLCIIGICTVLDELPQNYNHQRNALMLGATPREVLEVLLHSTFFCGMPRSLRGVAVLERILGEQNRMNELTETQLPLPA